jgi:hypothetical protein
MPVARTPGEQLRINSNPIVANPQSQHAIVVGNLDLYFPRMCMTKSVAHCLAGDSIEVIAED